MYVSVLALKANVWGSLRFSLLIPLHRSLCCSQESSFCVQSPNRLRISVRNSDDEPRGPLSLIKMIRTTMASKAILQFPNYSSVMRRYLWGGQSPTNCSNNLLWACPLSCLKRYTATTTCSQGRVGTSLRSFSFIRRSCSARIWFPVLFVNSFLCQGVRYVAFVSCLFVGWQALRFVVRVISHLMYWQLIPHAKVEGGLFW